MEIVLKNEIQTITEQFNEKLVNHNKLINVCLFSYYAVTFQEEINTKDVGIDSLKQKLDENENNQSQSKKLVKAKSIDEDRDRDSKSIPDEIKGKKVEDESFIYVFECKQWLAKDQGDKKIERILKVTNILNAKQMIR